MTLVVSEGIPSSRNSISGRVMGCSERASLRNFVPFTEVSCVSEKMSLNLFNNIITLEKETIICLCTYVWVC